MVREPIYFVLDDTQALKRAKKRDAVGELYKRDQTAKLKILPATLTALAAEVIR